MAHYIVVADKGEDVLGERVGTVYEDSYPHHSRNGVFFIRTDDLVDEIARNLKIKGEEKDENVAGAILKLNASYSGFTKSTLWDWLTKHD